MYPGLRHLRTAEEAEEAMQDILEWEANVKDNSGVSPVLHVQEGIGSKPFD